jgi:eukaryotic-like serine/threonine-protein kinase
MAKMPPQDWNQIKQVFSAALGVAPGQRDVWLASACAGDADVRRAVDDLLRAHYNASNSFLEPSSLVLAASWLFRGGDTVAGRFKVIRRIARGAMGEVYQVYDDRLRLHVALKAIRPELLGDADTVERFRREVLVTRDIAHDGLCRVFDLVEHPIDPQAGFPDGTVVPCLTMQLLEGESLEDWLTRSRPVAPATALPLVAQIGEALHVLHQAGVVHRDLKPSNVMLVQTATGTRAVLTDFGLARPLDHSVFETQAPVQGGAPFFMAPELFRRERPSPASDIYAFGLVIDEMVTSARAFPGESLHALLLQKLGDGPAAPSARSTGLPRQWERTIVRCLAPDPQDRFESAQAVVRALTGDARRSVRPVLRRWMRQANPLRPSRAAAYGVAILLALGGAAALSDPAQLASPTSVSIQPFANLTNKSELEYLVRGTTSELTRRLRQDRAIRVYSPTGPSDTLEPSRSATYTILGDVQEAGGRLRISVQLTDTQEKTVLWAQRFEGSADTALDLEDRLAADTALALARQRSSRAATWERVIGSLAGRFVSTPRSGIGTTSREAYDFYLRARTLFDERTIPAALEAVHYLKRAIDADPNYALAYAALADVQGILMDLHHAPHAPLILEAEKYIEQAVALDPDEPDVQFSLGLVRQLQWRWRDAEAAYQRAIELHPTSARGRRWYGGLLLQFGRFEESLQAHRYALELDPSDFPSQSAYGHALFHAGRAAEAAAQLEGVLARKNVFYSHVLLGQVYAFLSGSDAQRRVEYFEKARARADIVRREDSAPPRGGEKQSTYADLIAALAWSYQGRPDEAAPYLDRLLAERQQAHVSPGLLARVYAAQRDLPRTLEALHQAELEHDREIYYINVSPLYAPMRNEPQFRALVARVGLSR